MTNSKGKTMEFDYIIVGSGASTAGLLNGFLQSGSKESIAVIERGSATDHGKSVSIAPHLWPDAAYSNSVLHQMTVEGTRYIDVPVGKGLGGSTNVNACLLVPPAADDFSTWPSLWKDNMMSYVSNIQDTLVKNESLLQFKTSIEGILNVDTATQASGLWRESTFPSFVTRLPLAIRQNEKGSYERVNFHDGLVEPLLRQSKNNDNNITWFMETDAERLLFDDQRVTGVECRESSSKEFFNLVARKEVILSSGVIETPSLLLASGIGMDDDLKSASIPSRGCNVPVGHNLMDHVILTRAFLHSFTNHTLSPSTVQALYNAQDGEDRFQFMLCDSASIAGIAPIQMLSGLRQKFDFSPKWLANVINSFLRVCFPVATFFLRFTLKYTPAYYFNRYFTFGTNIILLNPKSTGRVSITKIDPTLKGACRRSDVSPQVDSCYFTDDRDMATARKAWIKASECLASWFEQGIEVMPGKAYPFENESKFAAYARSSFGPYFHWCGTCATGSVLDGELRVKGVQNLRVCDASSFATIPAGPTSLTCAALGFGLSKLLFANEKKNK